VAKIVVVEDDPQIRALVQTMLSAEGHTVAATGDPTTAVDLVRAEQPDLIFCDIAMPGMDGYGVLRALQSDPTTARFPVVFLTAHREFSERVRAFRFGVVDYLTKPFSRKILLSKVERVLGGLSRRTGLVASADEMAPQALLEEVQREARTGVLTVTTGEGASRVVLRAGHVVQSDQAGVPDSGGSARFEELDPAHSEIVSVDPPALPGASDALPSFEALPDMVKDVLVVDDNGAFRRFLRSMLERQGFTVHEAADGEAALELAVNKRPWLIITDVNMPGMDGFELCRRVRSQTMIRQTPLLFLSGWDDYRRRYQGMELGADDFVSKGTPIRELLIRIQLILRRYTDLQARSRRDAGMQGQLQVIGAPGILQMCHLGRLTGVLTAYESARKLVVGFRDGEIVSAIAPDGQTGEPALFEFLAWDRGQFEFVLGDPGPGQGVGETFDQVVLEGCRRLDEQRRLSNGASAP
jgi:DNA-binding response OmpR family regulator